MRQEATGSTARTAARIVAPFTGTRTLWRWCAAAVLASACVAGVATSLVAAGQRPLYRVLSAQLSPPIKQVLALTCPGVPPSELVRWPQRPGTPDPSPEAPSVRVVMVVDEQNHRSRIRLDGKGLVVEPLGNCSLPARIERSDQLHGSQVGVGTGYIAEAWLAVPTLKYRHGILGDVVTAAELRASNRRGDILRYRLPDDAVFEDRWARMAYIDGQDTVLVVRSGLEVGSSLALYGLDRAATDAGSLVPLAQSEPFGASHRWLNPVGIADFDGDGHTQIAAVLTPHAAGALAVYQRQGAKLIERYRAPGFSNHHIYSGELGMSAVVDANGDGIMDLAVPSADHRTLRIVTFAHGRFAELQRISHDAEIDTAIAVQALAPGGQSLVYALKNGTVVVVTK